MSSPSSQKLKEQTNNNHCVNCNEVWAGIRAWIYVCRRSAKEQGQILRQAESERSRHYAMRITHEVNRLLADSTESDADAEDDVAEVKDADEETRDTSPEPKVDHFKLLSPIKRKDGVLYPPSSQDEEEDVETASTVTRNTEADAVAAALAEEAPRPGMRLFAKNLLLNRGQTVNEENIQSVLSTKPETVVKEEPATNEAP